MKKIALYGAGGFGREVACMIEKINQMKGDTWDLIGFFDDGIEAGSEIGRFGHVLGGFAEVNRWSEELSIALCIGCPKTLRKISQRISNCNISFPNLIDPSFSVADKKSFSIGKGNIIKANCSGTVDFKIGNYNVFNGFISTGHDVNIGDFNVIMPHSIISGKVSIGECNLIGVGSIILQGVKIGDEVTLGAGGVLMNKPKNGGVYIGNPAKQFKF